MGNLSAASPNIAASYSDGFLRVFDFSGARDGLSTTVRITTSDFASSEAPLYD